MKKILASALCVLLLVSFAGCGAHYKKIDVPKELKIDARNLSEDTDHFMSIEDDTPLLAAIPEQGLYIYYTDTTIRSGVLVKYDGLLQFFPWRFTPQIARPDVFIADYNGDGRSDIAFTYAVETAETDACENLHVLLRGDKGFSDQFYTAEKAGIECGNHLMVSAREKDQFVVYVDGEPTEFGLGGHGAFLGMYYKHVQDFTLGEEITVALEPGFVFDNEDKPLYGVMSYSAKLQFTGEVFTQTEPEIVLK